MQHFVPFVGFGFFDNMIMLLAGDFIDSTFCITFGMTTLAAAAFGNLFSDIFGLWISGLIETAAVAMGFKEHSLTAKQVQLLPMRILRNTSMILGISLGCILGMFPLIFPEEWRLWASREEKEEQLEASGADLVYSRTRS